VNAAVLAAIALALVVLPTGSPDAARAQQALPEVLPPIAGGAGLFMMPAQLSRDRFGAYLMDIDTQTLVTYEYRDDAAAGPLHLTAARNFRFDRRLGNFNTVPQPREVERMLEKEQASDRVIRAPGAPAPSPEVTPRTD
jgi:hypothetical protein